VGEEPTLAELLGARARAAAPSRLGLDIVGGGAIAAAAVWARPPAWAVIGSAAICFLCYGVWAFCERRLSAPAAAELSVDAAFAWRTLREAAAVLGIAAFVALLFSVVGAGLGTWIS
jgi:hypothetical protein